jgi:hypothetical protein
MFTRIQAILHRTRLGVYQLILLKSICFYLLSRQIRFNFFSISVVVG